MSAPRLETPWIVAHRPRRWEDFAGAGPLVAAFRASLLAPPPAPPECAFRLAVLYGKPGRGKTTLGELAGRECAVFEAVNASDERRGEDLRARLERFLGEGGRRGAAWRMCPAPQPPPPLCLLFLDEADGLGSVGQLTVLSFLEELEDAPRQGWTPRVLVACNDVGAIHAGILSRAHLCVRMPHPSPSDMARAASAMASPAALPRSVLASGDFRFLAQTLEVATAGAAEGVAAAGPAANAAETSDAPPAAFLRLILLGEGTPFDPSRHPPHQAHVPPPLRTLQDLWAQGHRADMLARWADVALPEAAMPGHPADLQARLIHFRRELGRCGGAVSTSALQVFGAYVRAFCQAPPPAPRAPGSWLSYLGGGEAGGPSPSGAKRTPGFAELLAKRAAAAH
jgi:hypothetical protein